MSIYMKQNFVCKWIALFIFGTSRDLGPASLIGFSWFPTLTTGKPWDRISKYTKAASVFDAVSSELLKALKISLVECDAV
jgi:hypothetical protein